MTAIQRDEAFDRLEDACCAEHDAMCEQRRLVAQAQGIAAGLEAQNALLRALCQLAYHPLRPITFAQMSEARTHLDHFGITGEILDSAHSLVAVLEADSGDTA